MDLHFVDGNPIGGGHPTMDPMSGPMGRDAYFESLFEPQDRKVLDEDKGEFRVSDIGWS
jgi:hypothetical protein